MTTRGVVGVAHVVLPPRAHRTVSHLQRHLLRLRRLRLRPSDPNGQLSTHSAQRTAPGSRAGSMTTLPIRLQTTVRSLAPATMLALRTSMVCVQAPCQAQCRGHGLIPSSGSCMAHPAHPHIPSSASYTVPRLSCAVCPTQPCMPQSPSRRGRGVRGVAAVPMLTRVSGGAAPRWMRVQTVRRDAPVRQQRARHMLRRRAVRSRARHRVEASGRSSSSSAPLDLVRHRPWRGRCTLLRSRRQTTADGADMERRVLPALYGRIWAAHR